MPGVKVTTDMGDWSKIPVRVRLAFVTLIAGAAIVGLAAGLQLVSIGVAVIALAIVGIGFTLVFDRRRPWWPDEPDLPVDPIGANVAGKLALFAAVGIGAAVLILAGVLAPTPGG